MYISYVIAVVMKRIANYVVMHLSYTSLNFGITSVTTQCSNTMP